MCSGILSSDEHELMNTLSRRIVTHLLSLYEFINNALVINDFSSYISITYLNLSIKVYKSSLEEQQSHTRLLKHTIVHDKFK